MDTPLTPDVLDSPAVTILCALEADGFRVDLTADGVLVIAPRSRLTPERMATIAGCKDAIRLLVRYCDEGLLTPSAGSSRPPRRRWCRRSCSR